MSSDGDEEEDEKGWARRYTWLLEPIKDLDKNFEINIVDIIEQFEVDLQRTEGQTQDDRLPTNTDNGVLRNNFGFTAASVLMRGTSLVYGRKMDYLAEGVRNFSLMIGKKWTTSETGLAANGVGKRGHRLGESAQKAEFRILIGEEFFEQRKQIDPSLLVRKCATRCESPLQWPYPPELLPVPEVEKCRITLHAPNNHKHVFGCIDDFRINCLLPTNQGGLFLNDANRRLADRVDGSNRQTAIAIADAEPATSQQMPDPVNIDPRISRVVRHANQVLSDEPATNIFMSERPFADISLGQEDAVDCDYSPLDWKDHHVDGGGEVYAGCNDEEAGEEATDKLSELDHVRRVTTFLQRPTRLTSESELLSLAELECWSSRKTLQCASDEEGGEQAEATRRKMAKQRKQAKRALQAHYSTKRSTFNEIVSTDFQNPIYAFYDDSNELSESEEEEIKKPPSLVKDAGRALRRQIKADSNRSEEEKVTDSLKLLQSEPITGKWRQKRVREAAGSGLCEGQGKVGARWWKEESEKLDPDGWQKTVLASLLAKLRNSKLELYLRDRKKQSASICFLDDREIFEALNAVFVTNSFASLDQSQLALLSPQQLDALREEAKEEAIALWQLKAKRKWTRDVERKVLHLLKSGPSPSGEDNAQQEVDDFENWQTDGGYDVLHADSQEYKLELDDMYLEDELNSSHLEKLDKSVEELVDEFVHAQTSHGYDVDLPDEEEDSNDLYPGLGNEQLKRIIQRFRKRYMKELDMSNNCMTARIAEWEARMEKYLEEEIQRPPFTIESYCVKVLSKFQAEGETKTFTELLHGTSPFDTSRYFFAVLQLINRRFLRISLNHDNQDDKSDLCVELVKLSRASLRLALVETE